MAPWIKPDYKEIALNMEVTAYVNTADDSPLPNEGKERGHSEGEMVEELCPSLTA